MLKAPPVDDANLALVLSGGGARAAYQVGLLRYLAARHPDFAPRILTGVSAGGIIATSLASREGTFGDAVARLRQSYAGRRDGDRDLSEEPAASHEQGAGTVRTERYAHIVRDADHAPAWRRSAARSAGAVALTGQSNPRSRSSLATGARPSAAARAQG